MKIYVKPSIEVIELQLNENIAAVPTTVYKGSKADGFTAVAEGKEIALKKQYTGLKTSTFKEFALSELA